MASSAQHQTEPSTASASKQETSSQQPSVPATSSTLLDDANTTTARDASSSIPTRKYKKTTSQPSSVTANASSPEKKQKRSFWSSLMSAFKSCIPSDGGPHGIDIDVGKAGTGAAAKESTRDAEKVALQKDASEKQGTAGSSSKSHPTDGHTKSKPSLPSALIVTDTPIEQDGDVTVVVPPSPHSHLRPHDETEGVMSGDVQPPGSTGGESSHLLHPPHTHHASTTTAGTITTDSEDASFTDDNDGDVADHEGGPTADLVTEDEDDEEERLIMQGGTGIPIGPDGKPQPLLPPVAAAHKGRKCLVLDMDETLLHSSFKLIPQADYVIPVEIEWQWHNVYVIKRPGVDNFLKKMGELYEIVVFTASLSKYADPVLDKLDVGRVVSHRLFRESCYNHKGNYVKDLSRLGRPAEDMIILDNSPASYIFHPNNAVPVSSWFNDPHDTELTDLCPFLTDLMVVDDVRGVLDGGL